MREIDSKCNILKITSSDFVITNRYSSTTTSSIFDWDG